MSSIKTSLAPCHPEEGSRSKDSERSGRALMALMYKGLVAGAWGLGSSYQRGLSKLKVNSDPT